MTFAMDLTGEQPPAPAPARHPEPASEATVFEQLREMLLGREKSTLARLENRIEDPAVRAEDVSHILPHAFLMSTKRDDRLASAMVPAIEGALRGSIKRNPTVVTDAIFPIIGPAIRKSIGDTFSRLIQTFSNALENSLSIQGLRWRIEAWRTSRPFAEVVLYRTLVYRVEQVLLVHRPTGLLLAHATAPEVPAENQDTISGMLSAIQDFMKDSFRAGPGEHLQTVRMGDLHLWVETGPHAVVAAVVRGQAPVEFGQTLERTLEAIHRDESPALAAFSGDANHFEAVRPLLEDCLQIKTARPGRSGISAQALIVFVLIAAALIAWGASAWRARAKRESFLASLRAVPGLAVVTTTHENGKFVVSGLKDPLAVDPAPLVERAGLKPDEVEFRWQPFLALHPDLTVARARARLAPPATVQLSWQAGILSVSGTAPDPWWRDAQATAASIPGVDKVDASGLRITGTIAERLALIRQNIEQTAIPFELSQARSDPAALNPFLASARQLRDLAQEAGAKATLVISGHADASGPEKLNFKLRRERAEWVWQELRAAGLPETFLRLAGPEASAADSAARKTDALNQRRVTFAVLWEN